MPTPPYLILGFDADPASPSFHQIIADIEETFPPDIGSLVPLGVANCYLIEVGEGTQNGRLRALTKFFRAKDLEHGDGLRWYVQLCRSAELSNG